MDGAALLGAASVARLITSVQAAPGFDLRATIEDLLATVAARDEEIARLRGDVDGARAAWAADRERVQRLLDAACDRTEAAEAERDLLRGLITAVANDTTEPNYIRAWARSALKP